MRAAIAPIVALIAVVAGCSSGSADSSATDSLATDSLATNNAAEPGSSVPANESSVVTAPSSGAGDTIAFCSLASGTTQAVDADAVVAAFDDMAPVAPSTIAPALAIVADAWTNGEAATDEVTAASDDLEAYVLEECGIVAEFDPLTS